MTERIEAKVRDFRGIAHVDLELAPIALVGGRNGSGKTSLSQAVASVLTGEALPFRGIAKGGAGVLVRGGFDGAAATVQSESGTARLDWPGCTRITDRRPPEASIYAAGLRSVVDPDVDRVKVLSDYMRAAPTRDDLALALAAYPRLAIPTIVDAVWNLIETRGGFDAAYTIRKDRGAELKGQWRQVTGVNYGSRIAAAYRPELDAESRTTPELVAQVETARQAFERAVAASAISGEQRRQLEADAAEFDARVAAVTTVREVIEAAEARTKTAADARAACLPADAGAAEMPCAHCGGFLVWRRINVAESVLEKAPTDRLGETELKARRLAIAGADAELSRYQGELAAANRMLREAEAQLTTATVAKATLVDTLPAGQSVTSDAERAALAAAERRLNEVRTKREADAIRDTIDDNDILLGLLEPDGLRARKLGQTLDAFNSARLVPLTTAAGWLPVTINPDLQISYGGRLYAMLSASEQFRVRVILQVAMAQLDGSAMMIIDGADILDPPARSELFALLSTAALPAIVTMTAGKREQVPELAAAGLGRSYWLTAGVAAPLAEQAKAA